jgi:hypothetical protein
LTDQLDIDRKKKAKKSKKKKMSVQAPSEGVDGVMVNETACERKRTA